MAAKTSSTTPGARPARRASGKGPRVTAITLTGLGVLVIAACAVVLSYNGIYQIARQGNVDPQYAHMYPGAFTLLLLMTFWTSYLLRDAPRSRRLWVDALTLGLILVAAFASALRPLGYQLLPEAAVVVAAVAPWAALLIAFRVWLWVVSHLRGEQGGGSRRPARPVSETDSSDTAPLPTEPVPKPAEPGVPTSAPRKEGATIPMAALLWPRTHDHRPRGSSSVRLLEREEIEEHAEDTESTSPPVGADESENRDTPPEGDILPFSTPDPRPALVETAEETDEHQPPPLPKRTPKSADNSIKKAAVSEPGDTPGAGDGADRTGSSGADSGQQEDGFVHDLPMGDPTSDEADTRGHSAPEASEGPGTEDPLEKRPMVLRPRRTPMADLPEEPPSRRVRSEPTPPEEPNV